MSRITPFKNIFAKIIQRHIPRIPSRNIQTSVEDPIVVTEDGSTFVCWHPEKPYPYEFTQPMPIAVEKPPSVLRNNKPMATFKQQLETSEREELMKLTYTTKHRWFPRARDIKAKKTPRDREYL